MSPYGIPACKAKHDQAEASVSFHSVILLYIILWSFQLLILKDDTNLELSNFFNFSDMSQVVKLRSESVVSELFEPRPSCFGPDRNLL